jgi:hypothetical protein
MATGRIGTTPVLTTRWSKAPSAGTTSLSGLDDNSVSLVYSVGYEAVYQNGVLLSRGNDYTATNGTTITLTTATVAGDIIEVFANQTIPLTDTYSQTVANSLFVNQSTFDAKGDLIVGTADNAYSRLAVGTNGQVLTAASTTGTGLTWATPTSGGYTLLSTTTLSSTTTTISSISQSYTDLLLEFRQVHASGSTLAFRTNGITTSNYFYYNEKIGSGVSYAAAWQNGGNEMAFANSIGSDTQNPAYFKIYDYSNTSVAFKYCEAAIYSDNEAMIQKLQGVNRGTLGVGIDSITIFSPGAGTISGTVLCYGVK